MHTPFDTLFMLGSERLKQMCPEGRGYSGAPNPRQTELRERANAAQKISRWPERPRLFPPFAAQVPNPSGPASQKILRRGEFSPALSCYAQKEHPGRHDTALPFPGLVTAWSR